MKMSTWITLGVVALLALLIKYGQRRQPVQYWYTTVDAKRDVPGAVAGT